MALSSSSPATSEGRKEEEVEEERQSRATWTRQNRESLTTSQLDKTNGGNDQVDSTLFLNQFQEKHLWQRASQTINTEENKDTVSQRRHREWAMLLHSAVCRCTICTLMGTRGQIDLSCVCECVCVCVCVCVCEWVNKWMIMWANYLVDAQEASHQITTDSKRETNKNKSITKSNRWGRSLCSGLEKLSVATCMYVCVCVCVCVCVFAFVCERGGNHIGAHWRNK